MAKAFQTKALALAKTLQADASRITAAFVPVQKYSTKELNDAAKVWIARTPDQDINEPWVFLIGPDGKIQARFDNVVTRGELEPLLQKLPPMKS